MVQGWTTALRVQAAEIVRGNGWEVEVQMEEDVVKRRVGRPRLNPQESERPSQYVGFKCDDELFGKLQAAGVVSGRSIGPETRHRAAMTFVAQDAVEQSLRVFWGDNAGLIMLHGEMVNWMWPNAEWRTDIAARASIPVMLRHALDVYSDPESTAVHVRGGTWETRAEMFLHHLPESKKERLGQDWIAALERRHRVVTAALEKQQSEPPPDGFGDDILSQVRAPHLQARREQQHQERKANFQKTIERSRRAAKRAENE